MKYSKPALNFEQQANLLIKRGLIVPEHEALVHLLMKVNYYRLSGYLYTFKKIDPITSEESFVPGTNLDTIVQRYEFDRKLRILLMDAIERIEVAILRTQFVQAHVLRYGPFGYTDKKNYSPDLSSTEYSLLMSDVSGDETRSSEEFIKRYRTKYFEEDYLPFWMAVEIMSFGQLYTIYRKSERNIKMSIASQFGLHSIVFDSWLHTLNYIRNACAHHVRLWNRPLPIAPLFPYKKNDPNWYEPVLISNQRVFAVLTITRYLLQRIDDKTSWPGSLDKLLNEYPQVPKKMMGFPENWQKCKYWQ